MGGHPLAIIDAQGQRAVPISVREIPIRPTTIQKGDVLRITRDFSEEAVSEEQDFLVRLDGRFAYPFVGAVQAAGKRPEELAEELAQRLAAVFAHPSVTVNITSSPANHVFVGGEVRTPGQYSLAGGVTLLQSLYLAGGLLSTADQENVAILRENSKGIYDVYFVNSEAVFHASTYQRQPIYLQPLDIVFVPKSAIGNAVEVVDLYMNRLVPFTKNISIGAYYSLFKQ